MKRLILFLLPAVSFSSFGQHCPWDCSGMMLMKSDLKAGELQKLNPVLVDAKKNIVVDTMYGTGLETYDSCRFMFYDDFMTYRTERTKVHYWYRYDTLYKFAKEYALIKFNFCRYKRLDTLLYVRFNNLNDSGQVYSYIEVPQEKRIHLHDYNMQINRNQHDAIREAVQPFVLNITRQQFGLIN